MLKLLSAATTIALVAIAGAVPAMARSGASAMREGSYVLAPFSFAKFCIDYPDECRSSEGPTRVHLSAQGYAELVEVNRSVNASIRPTPDTSKLRYWRLNVAAGDCNNFAIQKRHELIARGWPEAALALTVAKTSWGEGHLVVSVRTDKGDLVLDNLRSKIIAWSQTGYQFIMRQSENNPQYWVELGGGHRAEGLDLADSGETVDVAPVASISSDVEQTGELSTSYDQSAAAQRAFGERKSRRGQSASLELFDGNASNASSVATRLSSPFSNGVAVSERKQLAYWFERSRITLAAAAPKIAEVVGCVIGIVGSEEIAQDRLASDTVASINREVDPSEFGFM
jgi:predicted transglutaminase-like cysteine proteinase